MKTLIFFRVGLFLLFLFSSFSFNRGQGKVIKTAINRTLSLNFNSILFFQHTQIAAAQCTMSVGVLDVVKNNGEN